MSNLAIALRMASAGLHVFPVSPDSRKRPTVRGSWRDNSTTDESTLRAWWRIRANHLCAIDLHKAGLLVLDGDRHPHPQTGEIEHDGVENLRNLFRGRNANVMPVVWTPSGGVHVYLKNTATLGNGEGELPPGINVRGSGGYVVAPGCVRPDGKAYTEGRINLATAFKAGSIPDLPDWLTEIIKPKPEPMAPIKITPALRGRREQAYAAAVLEGNARQLACKGAGSGRNVALNWMAFRSATHAARGWIGRSDIERVLFDASTACALVRDDGRRSVMATLNSAITAGLKNPASDLKSR